MIDKLKDIIKENWGLVYEDIDQSLPLIHLAEEIACRSENCTLKEAYEFYIDNPALHLPGLIAFYIIDELGFDVKKVNAGMSLSSIFSTQK
jgi:hypothetical protein